MPAGKYSDGIKKSVLVLQSIKQLANSQFPKLTFQNGLLLFSIDFRRLFLLVFGTLQLFIEICDSCKSMISFD